MEVKIKASLRAAQKNDLDRLKSLLNDSETYLDSFDSSYSEFLHNKCRNSAGDSLLHIAARNGYFELLRYLVEEKKMVIDVKNHDRKTPLHDAAQFSMLSCTQYLLKAGADVNAVKKADWTPLMLACTKQDAEVVVTLLQRGADPFFQNKDGWNSFHIASREGNILIIQSLVSLLLNPTPERILSLCNSTSKNGRKPLHTAAMHGHAEVVKFILENHFTDVNICDNCGTTPLMDACRSGSIMLVDLLYDHNADFSKYNKDGLNCLHVAAEAGATSVVVHLFQTYEMDVTQPILNMDITALQISKHAKQHDTAVAIENLIHPSLSATDIPGMKI